MILADFILGLYISDCSYFDRFSVGVASFFLFFPSRSLSLYIYIYTHTHTHTHTNTHTHTHIYIYVCVCVYIYMYCENNTLEIL